MSYGYNEGSNYVAPAPTPAPQPTAPFVPFVSPTPPAPTVTNSPNRPEWQSDPYQTSPVMANLERQGWTFVRNNPDSTGVWGGSIYDLGNYSIDSGTKALLDWLERVDWTDPSTWYGLEAPDGTVVTPPAPTEPAPAEDDSNIFADILGNIDLGDGYSFNIPDIFGDSTLEPTTPFVPTPTLPTATPTNGSGGANGGSTGTGVDLGNEDIPASDVVEGGQDSNLDDNNVDVNWLRLLGGGAAAGAASGLLSGMLSKDRSTTRTTDTVFSDMPELTKLTPTLLSPLYRS